ncbi:MAG: formate dehydrogenase accessory sulfurtransferase FdhD [Paracoccaceae bacterium]
MSDVKRPTPRLAFGGGEPVAGNRTLPEEVAVALSFNGSTHAVMMATPADLTDFAYGFALTEGIARPDEIESVEQVETPRGIDVQIWLTDPAADRQAKRRRTMAGPVGCGLCGLDSLDQALRDPAPVPPSRLRLSPAQIMQAIAALPGHQPLHDATRAVHAAGFYAPAAGGASPPGPPEDIWVQKEGGAGHLVAVREDVGRHNALDKLVGALIRQPRVEGAVVLTSRVSIDMVQKCAALGAPMLIAVSAPTAHAVRLAEQAGITLIALARPDRFEAFTHTDRIEGAVHVR